MDNNINVIDTDGVISQVEVLDVFNVVGYDDKEYIMYTKNKEIDEDNVEVFVSILSKNNDEYSLLNIDDDKEWEMVQKAIEEMGAL